MQVGDRQIAQKTNEKQKKAGFSTISKNNVQLDRKIRSMGCSKKMKYKQPKNM